MKLSTVKALIWAFLCEKANPDENDKLFISSKDQYVKYVS